ncbi:hypothetical protein M0655_14595 [Gordonia amicalis]|uniref:Uncharacterized protein n=1 Tax=Gordonia amicalis TaxID=89053 RepID=A0AAE4R602_9ACTN|nr:MULTISPECIES: hypothetical protein [Gordonia]MDV6314120.1 hypothetical protein [Gordonia amicalis]NKX79887.1 hypothetical protein [Gordonia amicalis]UPW12581.1 hypothetical protein M0655_14595 [Gordonia amicalis]GAC55398.1 hypothetical protein GOAMI_52_00220 [Gordonia amicalis NBRC 100051 = JCM 11271]
MTDTTERGRHRLPQKQSVSPKTFVRFGIPVLLGAAVIGAGIVSGTTEAAPVPQAPVTPVDHTTTVPTEPAEPTEQPNYYIGGPTYNTTVTEAPVGPPAAVPQGPVEPGGEQWGASFVLGEPAPAAVPNAGSFTLP